jgi:hypothetical protein
MSLRTALDPKPFDPFLYLHVLSVYPIFPRKFTIPVEPLTSHCRQCGSVLHASLSLTGSAKISTSATICSRVLSVLFRFVHPARERGGSPSRDAARFESRASFLTGLRYLRKVWWVCISAVLVVQKGSFVYTMFDSNLRRRLGMKRGLAYL